MTQNFSTPQPQQGGDNISLSDPSLSQIPGVLQKYYEPYGQMWQDTSGVMSKLGEGYKESPGYEFTLSQALQAGKQSAAAGGMSGSPMAQQEAQETGAGIASKDYYSYLNNAMKMYMGGVQGYGQLGQNLGSVLMSQSQLTQMQREEEERKEEEEKAQESQMWGSALGAVGRIGAAALL